MPDAGTDSNVDDAMPRTRHWIVCMARDPAVAVVRRADEVIDRVLAVVSRRSDHAERLESGARARARGRRATRADPDRAVLSQLDRSRADPGRSRTICAAGTVRRCHRSSVSRRARALSVRRGVRHGARARRIRRDDSCGRYCDRTCGFAPIWISGLRARRPERGEAIIAAWVAGLRRRAEIVLER